MNYQQAVEWLEALADPERHALGRNFARRVNLDTTLTLMDKLGNPDRGLPVAHIAGTKGKGTVAAMMESVARAAGHRTGLFTSPHLVSWRERIRVGGQQISEERVAELAGRVRPVAEAPPFFPLRGKKGGDLPAPDRLLAPTFFEACNAMALLAFAEDAVELAVIETGLGGRLDATNVLTPIVSVITTLGLDHTAVLGDTHAQVAREKAGIIKEGVPVVSAPQRPEAAEVVEEVARERSAPLHLAAPFEASARIEPLRPEEVAAGEAPRPAQPARGTFAGETVEVSLPLLGEHQLINAGVAARACELLAERALSIPAQAFVRGLETVRWPARVEVIEAHPWLILDCAHNRESMRALVRALQRHLEFERLVVVLGLSQDKPAEAIARELAGTSHVILTRADIARAMSTEQLRVRTEAYWKSFEVIPRPAEALARAREIAEERDAICVTGSLFLVGELMQEMAEDRARR